MNSSHTWAMKHVLGAAMLLFCLQASAVSPEAKASESHVTELKSLTKLRTVLSIAKDTWARTKARYGNTYYYINVSDSPMKTRASLEFQAVEGGTVTNRELWNRPFLASSKLVAPTRSLVVPDAKTYDTMLEECEWKVLTREPKSNQFFVRLFSSGLLKSCTSKPCGPLAHGEHPGPRLTGLYLGKAEAILQLWDQPAMADGYGFTLNQCS